MLHLKQFYIAWFFLHFLLVAAICCCDTLSHISKGYTFLPRFLNGPAAKIEKFTAGVLGEHLGADNTARHIINLYRHLAGIESGYGFFAPNVPDTYKLVFELHYPDGHVEYELPFAASHSAGLRLTTLIDNVGGTRSDALREVTTKMIAYTIWQRHPEATMVRAVLGLILLPTPEEFKRGAKESYQFVHAYDFRFLASPEKPSDR